jgi:phenylacetate-CoA ligase
VFLAVDGRIEDYVLTPDGRLVGRLDHIFKEQFDVAEAQIVQPDERSIDVFIVPRPTYSNASNRRLMRNIRARLGDEIRINIRTQDSIPREANGKFRAVKSRFGRINP